MGRFLTSMLMRKPADMDLKIDITIWIRNMHFYMLTRKSSPPPFYELMTDLLTLSSYGWYVTEILWNVLCSKVFKEPSDDDDPDSKKSAWVAYVSDN